ncbi:hypothetical protein KL905_000092 [Ogataea polymorpha]|uniref:NADH-ubiquinone oxidoreductase n=1 Tax=Ogataea polymorpha TaxID=460523 RepID=A0A1B7SJ98_9ASCO|nr:uncharacterized protein OGAPODRAFT_16189 [Ogataea polymorpha]KAG7882414.1 hypothetical protein KL937_000985 [Ogataea polymorpha]KAG7891502.1 hypothetical protein KL936_001445 [Ogataea polymorpha]KAG7894855.1 hypothetical protein KL908_001205 [Ogataea polymorpha]KAG7902663.1 hypothetical protein KL935_001571 [Ogataea polymorpha]KAG7911349.1 hypothetical protein KL906_000670 [Ogataea polymorpha]
MSSTNTFDSISTSKVTDKLRDTQYVLENAPLPKEIPHVKEIGATTGPLVSASFFIGDRCKEYNDDFMKCHQENGKNGTINCLTEGRRVTRCAASVIRDLNTHCKKEFELHFQCLNYSNMELKNCRKAEWLLNNCVFKNLNLQKRIPDDGNREVFKPGNQIYEPLAPHPASESAYHKATHG